MNRPNNILVAKITGAAGIFLFSTLTACDNPAASSRPTTQPAVASATTQPAEVPPGPPVPVVVAYPIRPPSILAMDGRDVAFPAAKLAVIGRGSSGLTLRLCSDDPPTAIDPGYAGNSYVLDMRLMLDRLDNLPSATWDYKSSDGDDSAGVSGIYLHNREEYRPADVHVSFQKDGDDLLVNLNGRFVHTNPATPTATPDTVQVSGCLKANKMNAD